jgi:hypothetical protein
MAGERELLVFEQRLKEDDAPDDTIPEGRRQGLVRATMWRESRICAIIHP